MEYWDIYDVERKKTGKEIVRGEELKENEYHLVVHACIFNSNGEMLIQQRQSFKDGWPNMWDLTCGGSAIKGETSQMAVKRELFEELGIEIDINNIRPNFTVNFDKGFNDIYLINKDIDLTTLKFQYEEVQNAKWASREEIISMILKGEFIPFFPNFINLMFDSRNQYGFIKR
ncbi:MAG: NUDIX domain-containing protein [Clostridiales bacterium]|nr:NUDIX domain-containing protein [Clostridiales bacterium]